MFVEVTRLLTVLLCTAAGYGIGRHSGEGLEQGPLVGAALGALFGYLLGGVGGRLLRRAWGRAEDHIERVPTAQLLAGTLGAVGVGGLAALLCIPALVFLPWAVGWLTYSLVVWLAVSAGFAISALAHRVVPPGLVEVGRKLGLPPLDPSEVVLHSHTLAPRAREALHVLAIAFREYNSAAA